MDSQKKVKILNEVKRIVSENTTVGNIKDEETKVNYQVTFDYANDIACQTSIRKKGDLFVAKINGDFVTNEDASLEVIADEICKKTGFTSNLYDESFIFQKVTAFGENSDEEAEKLIFSEIERMFDLINDNLDVFKHSDAKSNNNVSHDLDENESKDKDSIEDTSETVNDSNTEISDYDKDSEDSVETDNTVTYDENDEIFELMKEIEEDEKEIEKITVQKPQSNRVNKDTKNEAAEIKIEKKEDKMEESVIVKDLSVLDSVPNIQEQIKEMYADVDRIFNEKKSQADKRERTLNEFAKSLQIREEELELKTNDYDKELFKKKLQLEEEYKVKEESLTRTYLEKEIKLDEIKKEYNSKLDELYTEKQQLEFEKKKIETQKETLLAEQESLKEREKLIDTNYVSSDSDTKNNEELNSKIIELNGIIDDITIEKNNIQETLERKIEEILNTSKKKDLVITKFKEKLDKKDSRINELSFKLDEVNKELTDSTNKSDEANSNDSNELVEKLNEEIKSLMEKLSDSEKEVNELNAKLELSDSEKEKFKTMYLSEKEEKEKITSELEQKSNNMGNVTTSSLSEDDIVRMRVNEIKQEVEKIGLKVEIIPSNGDVIIASQKDNCTICINANAEIIYCEKQVKKPDKYKSEVEKWTQEDIRVSYAILNDTNKFVCKYTYKDVSKAIMEILEKFKSIV